MTPTDMNPVDELLAAESDRDRRARELGAALTALLADVETYRAAWKAAQAAGFARTDLLRVGFVDPAKLPRPRRTATTPARETPPAAGPRHEPADN
ncbi:hypothetical protein E4J66_06240 [Actinomyces viscosus]|uniref:Uncharacterized protein n=1 Tax=Actinomyces viscosus TaxID=1656 RepID=A0A448PPF0_ACTVI|nr:hypothetical protein [Actinomyces viscosus]TFH52809.1 hypothetical protein E4J66_06240 [Actinomyces viscosus]VEI18433.1 Uncharacterised protein [Actinomyces viscosus]